MNLSKNFTLKELTFSQTAARLGIDNTPPEHLIKNGEKLCKDILQPLRDELKSPLIISSGYRCHELNKAIHGSDTSQHMQFLAADVVSNSLSPNELIERIVKLDLPYDQLILEFGSWVHVSTAAYDHSPRKQRMNFYIKDGKTIKEVV